VQVWTAVESVPELADLWKDRLPEALATGVMSAAGSTWNLRVDAVPAGLAHDVLTRIGRITIEMITSHGPEILKSDKLFVLVVRLKPYGTVVQVRELDCRTESFGPVIERLVKQPARVGIDASAALIEAFAPLAAVERVDGKEARLQLRAGLLITSEDSASSVPVGSFLRPVVRHLDRYGNPKSNGIQQLPWTVLEVTSASSGELDCEIHSGVVQPLRTRRTRNVEQVALAIRAVDAPTKLRLVSRSQPDRPLTDYEIYVRPSEDDSSQLIGRSDARGIVEILPGPDRLQVLYVKNGAELLARLPVVFGERQPELTAMLPDDDPRLQAEGQLLGLQERLVDTVTRRALLSMKIRQHVAQAKWAEAESLVDELRELPTREDLRREIRQLRQDISSNDRQVQRKIDKLLAEMTQRLDKQLDPKEVEQLRAELAGARQ
jgi:hypothetical protein